MSIKRKNKVPVSTKSFGARVYVHRWFYVMALPVFIFILLFNYLPMFGIRFAFYKYTSVTDPVWVGLDNFQRLLSKQEFQQAFFNTIELSVIKLLLNTFMAVVVSLLLNEIKNLAAKKTVQTIIYLPHFMSWVVTASVFRLILSPSNAGLVNSLLVNFGILEKGKEIYFLADKNWWRPVFYIINIWKDTGWGTILYLATLAGISPDLYEAAQIDGANRWNQMRFITLPSLANTIITVLILNLAKIMNLFESVFVMYNPAVYEVSDVLQTYVYRRTFGLVADYGYTTAVGLTKSLVGCVLVLICNYASKKVRGRGIV
ncbi:ABC transporter permease [Clostridium sp. Marseille-P299]|uniref:ABC transporter permease n=1 Tax=Clostridium sp. Marseille-P299 TaxID=1805477 RepID=UPI000833C7E9|nr:ABC transporter permease subunit [Clostridium sp. Marseille-P299]